VRAGCPTVIAEHELLPITEAQLLATASAPTTPPPTQPAGAIPWATFSDYSVNAAGADRHEAGYLMWTHAITGNSNVIGNKGFHGIGTGNKAMLGTDAPALLGLPLAQLTALSARYALRTAGNAHILNRPYINILIDVNGDGTLYKIGVLDRDPNPALNLLVDVAQADPTDHEYQLSWIGAGKLKIVNELPGVTPAVDLGAGWHNKVFQDQRHPRRLPRRQARPCLPRRQRPPRRSHHAPPLARPRRLHLHPLQPRSPARSPAQRLTEPR
jgi:hypothetical protein